MKCKDVPIFFVSFSYTSSRHSSDLLNAAVVYSQRKRDSPFLQNRIDYIDTQFITKPFWDTSPDWNHLHYLVSDVEALYYFRKFILT